ncbi:MAG TPA: glycosyltransferase, partial [Albitalea sp.]|nr:glycosyltransferase [Albitalea sp.]
MKYTPGPLDSAQRLLPSSHAFASTGEADFAGLFGPVRGPVPRAPTALEALTARVSDWNHGRLARRHARRNRKVSVQRQTYRAWIAEFDTVTPTIYESFKLRERDLAARPLISVVMPVFNPQLEQLVAAVRSVQCQIYEHWELCIADDASTRAEVRTWLAELARRDERVKLVFRATNGHI